MLMGEEGKETYRTVGVHAGFADLEPTDQALAKEEYYVASAITKHVLGTFIKPTLAEF